MRHSHFYPGGCWGRLTEAGGGVEEANPLIKELPPLEIEFVLLRHHFCGRHFRYYITTSDEVFMHC